MVLKKSYIISLNISSDIYEMSPKGKDPASFARICYVLRTPTKSDFKPWGKTGAWSTPQKNNCHEGKG